MKRLAMILVLSTGIFAGPTLASHESRTLLNRENIGGALGAVIGGLAGNELVNGKGKSLATAAGAVGGFVVGRNIGRNYGGAHGYGSGTHGQTGRQVGYPGTGVHQQRVYPQTAGYKQRDYTRTGDYGNARLAHNEYECCDNDSRRSYPVHSIHEKYIANCTSNVRAGPSTRYHVIDQVRNRELVTVIGKVRGRNWYKVRVGSRIGYIYAPLLDPAYHSRGRYGNRTNWYR